MSTSYGVVSSTNGKYIDSMIQQYCYLHTGQRAGSMLILGSHWRVPKESAGVLQGRN